MAQNPYLMNQIAQGFNFNPGGAFVQGQQDKMSMIAAQYQQQLAQMQMAQAQAAAEQQAALRAAQTAFAAEKLGNPQYAPLVDSNTFNRAQFPAADDTPATVREWQAFSALPPEEQKRYLEMKRASQFQTVAGVPTQFPPGAQPVPLSTLEQEANAAATIRGAESGASAQAQADVSRAEKAPIQREAAMAQIKDIDTMLSGIEEAEGLVGLLTTGLPGQVLGQIAGSPAYDFRAAVDTLRANLAFDTLQQMRDMSPTGGALGQVSERELRLLESALRSLDPGQSRGQVLRNIETVRKHYQGWRDTITKSYGLENYGSVQRPEQSPQGQQAPKSAEDYLREAANAGN